MNSLNNREKLEYFLCFPKSELYTILQTCEFFFGINENEKYSFETIFDLSENEYFSQKRKYLNPLIKSKIFVESNDINDSILEQQCIEPSSITDWSKISMKRRFDIFNTFLQNYPPVFEILEISEDSDSNDSNNIEIQTPFGKMLCNYRLTYNIQISSLALLNDLGKIKPKTNLLTHSFFYNKYHLEVEIFEFYSVDIETNEQTNPFEQFTLKISQIGDSFNSRFFLFLSHLYNNVENEKSCLKLKKKDPRF
eukprot:TRINITY_DN11564_c0_g1_i1.p1 TRINITY_DN11564_c0_g1~~TRINITY_DN11564_c0_g1_i1.p1  ORF type:complete len:252 (+),score=75.06 TRINITY_DN11564_c0_g1_i1:84-839(+)